MWPLDEVKKLTEGCKMFGKNWREVRDYVGGDKTDWACKRKAERIGLFGNVKDWTDAEEQKLGEGIRMFSEDWTQIAAHVGTNRSIMGLKQKAASVQKRCNFGGFIPKSEQS
jgi:hypothetical protein